MSDTITIARPYAKAIFEHAQSKGTLGRWSEMISRLSMAVLDDQASRFITNPATTSKQQADLLMSIFKNNTSSELSTLESFVATLANSKRLLVLPEISVLYEEMRADEEKTLTVNVISYAALSQVQEDKLIDKFSRRLNRQVTLNVTIDQSILGGAIFQADDLVIDGSVRGKLNKLSANLVA